MNNLGLNHPFRVVVILLCLVLSLSAGSFSVDRSALAILDSDFQDRDPDKEALGQLLFFDKVLSGNRNMSCATCHHPFSGTGDALSLPIGEGGKGLGRARTTGRGDDAVHERVPRNSPALFNLGAKEFVVMFHDGRVMVDPAQPSGFATPAGADLPNGLDSALAAQAMFPVTSGAEMAGQMGENSIGNAAAANSLAGPDGVWAQIAVRLRNIDEYVDLFRRAFPDIQQAEDITYVHAANAIAAYESAAFQCTNSPFDQYLNGDNDAMSEDAIAGMDLFYGEAGCVNCHSGKFQTDLNFYAIGIPQIGPGKGDNLQGYNDGHDDFGLERVTLNPADRFKFRTPSLRQVTLTGPWGHDGAYGDLEMIVRHHLDPVSYLNNYDYGQAILPYREDLSAQDFVAQRDPVRRAAIESAIELEAVDLSSMEVAQVMSFLESLTDLSCVDLLQEVPVRVPSGLSLCDDGCGFEQGDLSQAERVARMIPNDPPGVDDPSYVVGDEEVLLALNAWIHGEALVDGESINDATMMTLITLWANGAVVR
jgi:cytochrome c peroxidase